MSAETDNPSDKPEIAYILFIDTVGYSKLTIGEQHALQGSLTRIVRETACFREAKEAGKLVRLPTGDGMALVFADDIEAPLNCAVEIATALRDHAEVRIRMGIHSGPVSRVLDVNDQTNIAGAGVNTAQRVMSCGDAGHILLSKHIAEDLVSYSSWQGNLHDIGDCEVKHGEKIGLVNFYTDKLGNSALPERVRQIQHDRAAAGAKRRQRLLWIGLGLVALAGAAVFLSWHNQSNPEPPHSIAVLPFGDFSPEHNQEYFADGVAEQIINSLAQIKGLLVVARTSSFALKGKDEDIRTVGRRLHVRYAIEGSVSRINRRVRVAAQLIDVSNGYHVWSRNYDSDDVDLLSLQSNVAEKIADALQTDLRLAERQPVNKALTANAEASELYRRGQYLLNKRTADSIQEAREFFGQAVAKDADFALGHAGIAEAYILLGEYGVLPVEEAANRAWPEVSAALQLDEYLADGYLSRAILLADFQWKWDAAEMDYRKAIKLNPNNAKAHHWFALNLAQLGRAEEALKEVGIAQKLDPLAPIIRAARAKILLTDRRFKEAVAESQKALEVEPNFAPAYSVLAQALAFQGQYEDAIAAARKYVDLTGGGDQELLELAYVKALARREIEAQQVVIEVRRRGQNFSPYDVAAICIASENPDAALEWIEKAITQHAIDVEWIGVDPRMDGIRSDARFGRLLALVYPHPESF